MKIKIFDDDYEYHLENSIWITANCKSETPGIKNSLFKIWVNRGDKLDVGDIIIIGDNKHQPLIIEKGPRQFDRSFIYDVKLMSEEYSEFYPPHYIEDYTLVFKVVVNEENKLPGGGYLHLAKN